MDYKTISVERKAEVGILYLNRPEVLNALSNEMREELMDFMEKAAADDGLRVLILTGKGRAFSAGADLNLFKQQVRGVPTGRGRRRFGTNRSSQGLYRIPETAHRGHQRTGGRLWSHGHPELRYPPGFQKGQIQLCLCPDRGNARIREFLFSAEVDRIRQGRRIDLYRQDV